jgi:predicted transglutaminase-like cysteine proteinase
MLHRPRACCRALLAAVLGLGLLACPRLARASALADLPDSTNNVGAVLSVPLDALDAPAQSQTAEPFRQQATARVTGSLQDMWRSAANRLPTESAILARCRADSAKCSPAAAKFLAIIDRAAKQKGWTRIAEINRAINLDIRPVSDVTQYGAAPLWPTPLMTFAANAGDCKDYAVAKFVALRELGLSADDLRIVIVHIRASAEYHALTAVRYDSHWFVLDNRTSTIKRDSDVADYEPLFVVDGANVRRMQLSPPEQTSAVNAGPPAADVTLFAGPESLPALS